MKRFRDFCVGVIVGAFLFGGLSFAATGIDVDFTPMKFFFDGIEKKLPEGQQGFIYQGRTYVPLRFMSESIGKDVKWVSETGSMYVGVIPKDTPKADIVPTLSFTDKTGSVTLNHPKNWLKMTSDGSEVIVYGSSESDYVGIGVNVENKPDLEGIVMDVNSFNEYMVSYFQDSLQGARIISSQTVTIGGKECSRFDIEVTEDNQKMRVTALVRVDGTKFIVITAITGIDVYSKYKDSLEEIFNSTRFN